MEGSGIRLKDATLDQLPALFGLLPEGHYRIYVVYTETNSRRLALDFNIRAGAVIDPSDDSDGGRDRPRTDEVWQPESLEPSDESASILDQELPTPPATPDQAQMSPSKPQTEANDSLEDQSVTAMALAAAAYQTKRSEQVEGALCRAHEQRWHRLFRRRWFS